MDQKQRDIIIRLITALEDAHDTHIWAEDDPHPQEGCTYCLLTQEARKEFGIDV